MSDGFTVVSALTSSRSAVFLLRQTDQVFDSKVVRHLQVKLLRRRKRFSQPALGGRHLFLHRPDHFAGHSLVACPFADNSSLHVYLRLLSSRPPPSSSSLVLLLSSSDGCWSSVWFFRQSLTLSWGRQRNVLRLPLLSFPLHIFLRQKVWISSRTFYCFAAPEPWRSVEVEKRAVSAVTSSSLMFF